MSCFWQNAFIRCGMCFVSLHEEVEIGGNSPVRMKRNVHESPYVVGTDYAQHVLSQKGLPPLLAHCSYCSYCSYCRCCRQDKMTLAGKTMTRATRRGAVAKVQVVPAEKRAIIGERADAPPRQASSTPAGESAPADEPARTEVMTTPAEIVDSFVENRNTSARRRSADLQQTAAWTENTITTAKETVPLADNMASPGDRTAPRTGSTATPTTKIKRVTFAEDVVGGDASMRHGQESDKPRWADNPTRVKCKTCRKWRRLPNGVNRRPSQSSCACRMRTLGSDEATCRCVAVQKFYPLCFEYGGQS